jgi:hypothetical protein
VTAEPHGRTVILARGQEVTARPGRVRGYPVAVQLGATDLNLDLATAVGLYERLGALLGDVLPGGPLAAPNPPFACPSGPPPGLIGTEAHPDVPAIPGWTPDEQEPW